jgi:hypothetical protein
VNAFGGALGDVVVTAVEGASGPVVPRLGGRVADAALPLEAGGSADIALQRLDFADEVSLFAMGGEVCVEYGHFVKRIGGDRLFLPLGYANGLIGYIPTAAMLPEGGYEAVDSAAVYGLPSPFTSDVEPILHDAIRGLAAREPDGSGIGGSGQAG